MRDTLEHYEPRRARGSGQKKACNYFPRRRPGTQETLLLTGAVELTVDYISSNPEPLRLPGVQKGRSTGSPGLY